MSKWEFVQYGSGLCAPQGWENFDASPTLRIQRLPVFGPLLVSGDSRFPPNVRYGDIVKGLPLPAQSCRAVYCSHVLEHLSLQDFRTALCNTHRVLRPRGIFRLVVPDLKFSVERYNKTGSAHDFLTATGLGQEARPKGLRGLLSAMFGNSRHLWMWDYESLKQELRSAGFEAVRRACYGDSQEPRFNDVEMEQRWRDCLGIECLSPAQ